MSHSTFYIREVTISNFKSYGNQLTIPFSRELNCIVGKNGCGKSALLDAICCCLGVDYRRLRVERYNEFITHLDTKNPDQCSVQLLFQHTTKGSETIRIQFSCDSKGNVTSSLHRPVRDRFRYNGKSLSRERLRSVVQEHLGLSVIPNPLFLIQQNRVQNFGLDDSAFLVNYIHEVRKDCMFYSQTNGTNQFLSFLRDYSKDRQKTDETRLHIKRKLQECLTLIHRSEEEQRTSQRVLTTGLADP